MSHSSTVAISGSTGFVGSYLSDFLTKNGCLVIRLQREDFQGPVKELATTLSGVDALVNLAGAPIIKRWSNAYKKVLYASRIDTTKKLITACSLAKVTPRVFLSASAVGYYAATSSVHTENNHSRADDFLGGLSRDWEREALCAETLGMRTVIFRFGVVLGKGGGALKQMLVPFKCGLGGIIGNGKQAVSWIHLHDLARACLQAINDPGYTGAYNLTSPCPTTNGELCKTLGKILHRPVLFSIPKWAITLLYGEGAGVLIKGQRVLPERLLTAGFQFTFDQLEDALTDSLR